MEKQKEQNMSVCECYFTTGKENTKKRGNRPSEIEAKRDRDRKGKDIGTN